MPGKKIYQLCLQLTRSLVLRASLGVAGREDGSGKSGDEGGLRLAEEAGHEEIEEGPELTDPVLDGCAGENETVLGAQPLDGAGDLRFAVLYHMTLVENEVLPCGLPRRWTGVQ